MKARRRKRTKKTGRLKSKADCFMDELSQDPEAQKKILATISSVAVFGNAKKSSVDLFINLFEK